MAKQISPLIKLRGTIADLSFYKTQDGYLAREKGGVDGDRIKNDPKFRLTRLNGLEFGIGGKAGKLFRSAWKVEIAKAADGRVASRLTKLMVAILQTDPVSDYGERQVQLGEIDQLTGFEFNIDVPFGQVFTLPLLTAVDRVTGQVTVELPDLVPQADIVAPDGTTHYNIFAAAAAIDFAEGLVTTVRQATPNMPFGNNPNVLGTMNLALAPNSLLPLFLVVGIEFMKIVNGKVYPLSKGQSALQLAMVSLPA